MVLPSRLTPASNFSAPCAFAERTVEPPRCIRRPHAAPSCSIMEMSRLNTVLPGLFSHRNSLACCIRNLAIDRISIEHQTSRQIFYDVLCVKLHCNTHTHLHFLRTKLKRTLVPSVRREAGRLHVTIVKRPQISLLLRLLLLRHPMLSRSRIRRTITLIELDGMDVRAV